MEIEGKLIVSIYYSESSGFQIAKIKSLDGDITVSGYFPLLSKDLKYLFTGEYVEHPKYGHQFKATSFKRLDDNSTEGMINYLSSDLFTGIGPKTALKIVSKLGTDCISKIIADKSILKSIGFNDSKIENFYYELINNKIIEETIMELSKYDISSQMAMKLYNKYGNLASQVIVENPYTLIFDIQGYGFKKADDLAFKVGIAPDSKIRINAATLFVIRNITRNYGYTYVLKEQLIETVLEYIKHPLVSYDLINNEVEDLSNNEKLVIDGSKVYLPQYYYSEIYLANKINAMKNCNNEKYDDNVLEGILETLDIGITYTETQKKAIFDSLQNPISIITGGPGTGKTTVINGIIQIYARLNNLSIKNPGICNTIGLMAPTGRAAKRMYESTHVYATTIHRALGYNFDGEFECDESNPLNYKLIIVDEASMIDIVLAEKLFRAIRNSSKVIIVGDLDQLPSVGPGSVLKDLIDSKAIKTSSLTEIHRQAKDSTIIKLASVVKKGELTWDYLDYHDDLVFYRTSGSDIKVKILDLVKELTEQGYDPLNDIQVLSPMYKGVVGIDEINVSLQKMLNQNTGIKYGNKDFLINDKVLQLENRPDLGIMNGDIGIIQKIVNGENDYLVVNFDNNMVKMTKSDLDNLTLAYAISIHKSQGSEYPIVILPVSKMHTIMLKRKLLYTAITRAKSKLYVIGDLDAFRNGINRIEDERQTSLPLRINNNNRVMINIPGCPFTYLGEEDMENISPYDFMEE